MGALSIGRILVLLLQLWLLNASCLAFFTRPRATPTAAPRAVPRSRVPVRRWSQSNPFAQKTAYKDGLLDKVWILLFARKIAKVWHTYS
jgi:hypothetical protein